MREWRRMEPTLSKVARSKRVGAEMKASCPWGYTNAGIKRILPREEEKRFWQWMAGQTMMLCEGREYDYEAKAYKPSACAQTPHGGIVYTWDLEQYLAGGAALD